MIAKHSEIDSALIFGSRAKGNHRDDSDIDLAIIAPSMSEETFAQLRNQLDATLREIAIEKPARINQLKGLTGVGEKKLDNYGAAIVKVVSEYL